MSRPLSTPLLVTLLSLSLLSAAVAFSPPTAFLPRRPALRSTVAARVARRGAGLSLRCQEGPPLDKEPLDLSEENVIQALEEAKETLGTIFGNSQENRDIGITGDCSLVDLDGPFVTLRLQGRFWHKRADVLARLENYLLMRLPELIEVSIEDPKQLDDELPENQKA
mmetsp:Transcript_22432/g.56082  ORF Transcript_22432/g.56082 Transcript_22432/m.56082 type:complete len:167 (-) Transcript_22432:85-585(-)